MKKWLYVALFAFSTSAAWACPCNEKKGDKNCPQDCSKNECKGECAKKTDAPKTEPKK
jgi:hypothetical protein